METTLTGLENAAALGQEAQDGGFFVGGEKAGPKGAKGKGFAKFFKKKGPAGLILGLVLMMFSVLTLSPSLLPAALVARLKEAFDTIKVVNEHRGKTLFRHQLSGGKIKSPLVSKYPFVGKWFGEKFKLSEKQVKKLKAQGIEVDADYGGTGKTVLKMKSSNGKELVIFPDERSLKAANLSDKVEAKTFYQAFGEVSEFRNGFIRGAKTWRGSVGAWFDQLTVRFLRSNNLTRNRFKNFQQKVADENDGDWAKALRKTLEVEGKDVAIKGKNHHAWEETEEEIVYENGKPKLDKDGNTVTTTRTVPKKGTFEPSSGSTKIGKGATDAEIKLKVEGIKNNIEKTASGGEVVSAACLAYNVSSMISLALKAHVAIQVINIATATLEALQKVQAGDGADAPINQVLNALTENKENHDGEGKLFSNKSAMQSAAMIALFSGRPIDKLDPGILRLDGIVRGTEIGSNKESGMFNAIKNWMTGKKGEFDINSFNRCALGRAGASLAGAVSDIATIVSCTGLSVATFGLSCAAKILLESGYKIAFAAGVSAIAGIVVQSVVGKMTEVFKKDFAERLGGEDFGNGFGQGSAKLMWENHKNGGGSPTDKKNLSHFIIKQQESQAELARYERENLSPFDLSSGNTFLGSLSRQMIPIFVNMGSLGKTLGGISLAAKVAMGNLLPSARALDVNQALSGIGDCPYLESIGAVGNVYCDSYIVSDFSTMTESDDTHPAEIAAKVAEFGGIEESSDGEMKIKSGSNLAKYIQFCANRESPFGFADQQIASMVGNFGDVNTGSSGFDSIANGAIGAVPIVGDMIDLMQSEAQVANQRWISGEACVQKNTTYEGVSTKPTWDEAPEWDKETKYYQRFVEDQRLLDSMGMGKSAVVAFLEEEDRLHPKDNSYTGILARKMGVKKEQVIAMFEYLIRQSEIASYDPIGKGPMKKQNLEIDFEKLEITDFGTVADLPKQICYRDLRAVTTTA